MKRLAMLLALCTMPLFAAAQSVYIGDTVYVPMRSGPGSDYRIIIRALKTGTELTLLEKEINNGYYKVKSKSGQEGYIPSQYMIFNPPATNLLKSAYAERDQLKQEVTSLKSQLGNIQNSSNSTSRTLQNRENELASVKEELMRIKTVSAKSLEIDRRNKELVLANEQLMSELQTLQSTNQQLTDSTDQRWYLYGAGTLIAGLLLGVILPMIKPRKKNTGWA
ncbi:TIGR04211 family SH3 domain-containing protein [Sansalvadorimonas sp. 2012CJ34-2]|uniref:TIGR04211 family SH3 domain-containing protein n=1 Tax=Parendozoicomonas callyspongiae TaxID=2942213 RepID=A0ABT0PKE0_9GAMM|nr:TIGR04211 family SH3 domain-containing protein [Sansalvadorimonas sp. 2012CJ34-2]MCL6270928.1 TIGR04211 family SH3 domain-containing protein [Sansalvadorimonas sp. 2012CJ34-2]